MCPVLLALCCVLGLAASGPFPDEMSPDELKVLAGESNHLLHDHLMDKARSLFAARRRAVKAALASGEALLERQAALKAAYRQLLGPFPEKTPLHAKVTGTLLCEGFRIEKVVFESRPRLYVTANCYVPATGEGPWPGVLVLCGHAAEGKGCEAYQSVCILLALNGFVALIVDPMAQGERYPFLDEKGKPATRGGTMDHSLLDGNAILVGTDMAAYEAYDNLRAVDYLLSRPEVDRTVPVGCTGNSGGGTQATFLMALDDRIGPAAPSCYLTTQERVFETLDPQDGCQQLPGEGLHGIEHADYITMRAPKPTMILAAEQDFFDIEGTRTTFHEVKGVYQVLGHPDRVALFTADDGHGFSRPRREAAVQWMGRWLKGDPGPVKEPELTLQKVEDLFATDTGQVGSHFADARTAADFSLERALALAPERERFWKEGDKAGCLAEVGRLIGHAGPRAKPVMEHAGTLEREGYRIEKLKIKRSGEVPVPGLLFLPGEGSEKGSGLGGNGSSDDPPNQKGGKNKLPAELYVHGEGKAADAGPGGYIEQLVKEGRVVLSIDVRGFGETTDDPAGNRYKLGNVEYRNAVIALHIGKPLLGQRVGDVLAAFDVLSARPEVDPVRISLTGAGRAGPVALHAAALEEAIAEVTVADSLISWIDLLRAPTARDILTHAVPGALARYDLTDLVMAAAPRPVTIVRPVDGSGKPRMVKKTPGDLEADR